MNKILKGVVAGISALVMCVSAVPLSTSAATMTYLKGDVDGDGRIVSNDILMIKKYLNGSYTADKEILMRMDANNDNVINQLDIDKIYRIALGTDTTSTITKTICNNLNNESRYYLRYDISNKTTSTYYLPKLSTLNISSLSAEDEIMTLSDTENIVDTQNLNVVRLKNLGSGFIIDDHIIVTAAHCVYNSNGFVNDIEIQILNSSGTVVTNKFSANYLHIPSQYKSNFNDTTLRTRYDYALIYVDEDLSQYTHWSLGTVNNIFMSSMKDLSISGFTGDGRRYYSTGMVSDKPTEIEEGYRIFCKAQNGSGKSGGPMYYTSTYNGNTYKTVVGIYTGGSEYDYGEDIEEETQYISCAVRITPTILNFYYNNTHLTK